MKNTKLIALLGGFACACLLAPQVQAISITDPGVVGTVDPGTQSANPSNATAWANYLLSLGINTTVTVDAPGDSNSATETYVTTSTKEYSGTLSGGVEVNGIVTDVSAYTWVMAKYDGQNAGYILFYVPDLLNGTIPAYPSPIWGTGEQYAMSHIVGFGGRTSVPDGGTAMMLLGSALAGLGVMRRRLKI